MTLITCSMNHFDRRSHFIRFTLQQQAVARIYGTRLRGSWKLKIPRAERIDEFLHFDYTCIIDSNHRYSNFLNQMINTIDNSHKIQNFLRSKKSKNIGRSVIQALPSFELFRIDTSSTSTDSRNHLLSVFFTTRFTASKRIPFSCYIDLFQR